MRGHTRKFKRASYSWDTDTVSYDIDVYTSGGTKASVYVSAMYDDKPSKDTVRTFKSIDAAYEYVNGLRGERIA